MGDYNENAILNWQFNAASAPTIAASLDISLHTASVGDTGGGAEVSSSGTAYARLSVTRNTTNFPTTSTGTISNGTLLQWAVATANWGTVTSVGIWSGANLLWWGDLTASQAVNTNNRFEIPINDLDISLD
jgi:hypothetical protein